MKMYGSCKTEFLTAEYSEVTDTFQFFTQSCGPW